MLFVEVKKGNIEKALKDLKGKVIKTKQNSKLFDRKEFTKNYRPISRGQFDRYAKKKKYKTPYFLTLTKKQLKLLGVHSTVPSSVRNARKVS